MLINNVISVGKQYGWQMQQITGNLMLIYHCTSGIVRDDEKMASDKKGKSQYYHVYIMWGQTAMASTSMVITLLVHNGRGESNRKKTSLRLNFVS